MKIFTGMSHACVSAPPKIGGGEASGDTALTEGMPRSSMSGICEINRVWRLLVWLPFFAPLLAQPLPEERGAAAKPFASSSAHAHHRDALAVDGNRFSVTSAWAGDSGTNAWWWQIEFPEARLIGAILQVHGDHEFVLRHAPKTYVWELSMDGQSWRPSGGLSQTNERRLFRLHRLTRVETARFARLRISEAHGGFPVLREVEFYDSPEAVVAFPDWVVAVNVTHDATLPGHGQEFIPLAKSADSALQAQQVWLTDFRDDFIAAEPRPLCAFLSGSFKDWCEVNREHWRGVQQVLRGRRLPLWASCGGAQGLALVSEYGVDQPWDCPHCRDPLQPKTPLYTPHRPPAGRDVGLRQVRRLPL